MKKVLYLCVLFILGVQLCGCSGSETASTANISVAIGEINAAAPTDENSICEYRLIQNAIPDEREITLCYTKRDNYYDIEALSVSAQGLSVSENEYSFTSYQNFPTLFTDEIKEFYSIKDLDDELGQPYIYGENNGITAMLFKSYNTSKSYSLIYKKGNAFNRIDLAKYEMPFSMQITDNFIYLYSKEKDGDYSSDIVITEVELHDSVTDDGKTYIINVPVSSMGLEEIDNTINHDNIFIINNILYFSFNHFGKNASLAVCDLENMRGTFVPINDIFVDGRLFIQGNKIGLMIMDKQEDSIINWYDFNSENMTLTMERSLPVSIPETAGGMEYELYLFGHNFYYIDGLLCGFLYSKEDYVENMAYVEIVADTGMTSTFIPFKNVNLDSHKTWNYIICNNGHGICKYGGEL